MIGASLARVPKHILLHLGREEPQGMPGHKKSRPNGQLKSVGCAVGLEPTTTRTTIWRSTN